MADVIVDSGLESCLIGEARVGLCIDGGCDGCDDDGEDGGLEFGNHDDDDDDDDDVGLTFWLLSTRQVVSCGELTNLIFFFHV